MRISFIGHPGAGKTSAAELLSTAIHIERVDIDSIFDEHSITFISRRTYRRAFQKRMAGKKDWIIDSYHGHRMPDAVWRNSDIIVFIDLPRDELVHNVRSRQTTKRQAKDNSHNQATYRNTLKNLAQIYLLDKSLRKNIRRIKQLPGVSKKFVELRSKQDVADFVRQTKDKSSSG